jgi:hypothetical protein
VRGTGLCAISMTTIHFRCAYALFFLSTFLFARSDTSPCACQIFAIPFQYVPHVCSCPIHLRPTVCSEWRSPNPITCSMSRQPGSSVQFLSRLCHTFILLSVHCVGNKQSANWVHVIMRYLCLFSIVPFRYCAQAPLTSALPNILHTHVC